MTKDIYITGLGMISPQQSLRVTSIDKFEKLETFHCLEPDYKDFIPPSKARRMSRILKISYVSAKVALEEAGLENPQMINVGTSMGCLKDTTLFLQDIIDSKETVLKPTPFINSTHNTIAGLLAITYQSKGQNFTFSHTEFNFEHALLDSMIRMQEGEVSNVLLGGVDELTEETSLIKSKMLMENQGEGSTFFVLSTKETNQYYARIKAISFAYELDGESDLNQAINEFLREESLKIDNLDVLVSDVDLSSSLATKKQIVYKKFCGDYMTAASFGMGLAALEVKSNGGNALLINKNKNHSFSFVLLGR
ncbi:MAG: hypothetical protein DRI84_02270 [Bacteroidetes bacterium]|nr:MAG: hypothetical protein DRI84_02270 [Bacteroidota bacterium]